MVPVISILPLSSNSPFNICSVTEDRTPLNISTESTILSFLSRGHWRGIGGGKTISCYFLLLYSGVSNLAAFAWPGDKLLSSPLNVETDPKLFCSHWYPESLLTLQLTPPSPIPATLPLQTWTQHTCALAPIPSASSPHWLLITCTPEETEEQLWPEQTSKLLCYPMGWITPSPIRSEPALGRGTLLSLSFFGYSPLALEYRTQFPPSHSFIRTW